MINTRVMTTKLTLTIDDAVVSFAKKYAKNKGKSLSKIVENYLMTLTSKESNDKFEADSDVDLVVDIDETDPLCYTDNYFSLKEKLEKISIDILTYLSKRLLKILF